MQFWLPFVSSPQPLVAGSCVAARMWAQVRFSGGDALTLSVGECEARQRAYRRSREAWRALLASGERHAARTPLERHTAAGELFR